MKQNHRIKVGIIGFGYWGPNLARNFNLNKNVNVVSICDKDQDTLNRAKVLYPHAVITKNSRDITTSPKIDAVAVATPAFSHFELSKSALENGKHIFVEKPFTASVNQAKTLIDLAQQKKLTIMVDHTFLFTGPVMKIKDLIDNDELGNIYYYDSTRVNLGLFQHDINVIWDLAPHDFAIIDYIIKEKPLGILATGMDHVGRGLEDIAYITVYFEKMIAHINVNWMSPVKNRTCLIGGQKKMLVWNDLASDEKIKVYDKGIEVNDKEGRYKLLVDYRSGDMFAPKLNRKEALSTEIEYFIDCIMNDVVPFNDGNAGLRVVRLLEASDQSLKYSGKLIEL